MAFNALSSFLLRRCHFFLKPFNRPNSTSIRCPFKTPAVTVLATLSSASSSLLSITATRHTLSSTTAFERIFPPPWALQRTNGALGKHSLNRRVHTLPLPRPCLRRRSPRESLADQKWSTTMVFLTSTMIGSVMYVVGVKAQLKHQEPLTESSPATLSSPQPDPTDLEFKRALDDLKSVLPSDCISWDRDTLVAHGTSAWTYHLPTCLPGVVLYPRSTEDVVQIVKIANRHLIPVVPFSGGTSLEGHFNAPSAQQVTPPEATFGWDDTQLEPGHSFSVDFSRHMNKVVALHEADMDVVVQPGISYEELNAHLAKCDSPPRLFFPVDPGPGARIGGMIATGCSGTNAVKYGTMRENVINLTVVLPSGDVVKTRQRAKKCAAGPDLGKLFIGSEGCLGLVTEATLRLHPDLPTSVGVSHFGDVQSATETALDLLKSGISLACVELLDDQMMRAINKSFVREPLWEEKPSLFLKFTGTPAQIKSDQALSANIIKSHRGSRIKMAQTENEANEIWQSRKNALWLTLDSAPEHKVWTTDVCVPLSALPKLVSQTRDDLRAHGLKYTILGHVGDGNFHCLILTKTLEELAMARKCVDRMNTLAQDLDGTCTGEHGVGIGKQNYLERELGVETVKLLRGLKKMIDPKNIMNPGKLIPPP